MGQCLERTDSSIIPIPETEGWCSYCSKPRMFSRFSVGGVDPVSSILKRSQKVVGVSLSPRESLSLVVLMRTVCMAAPYSSYRQNKKRKTKPNNCKCPEQNIWKIKQVLWTETLKKKKNTALNKQYDCKNGLTQLSASMLRGYWKPKKVKDWI